MFEKVKLSPAGSALWHESVFVMPYLRPALFAQNYGNNVEAQGPVVNLVRRQEIAGGAEHSGLFGRGDGRLGWAEMLARSGLDLDKRDRPVAIDHNQIDFAALAGEVAAECLEALASQEPLAAFFAPSAESLRIGQQLASVRQQISDIVFRISLVIW